jgi:uncharacterized protein (TIGR00661 family)
MSGKVAPRILVAPLNWGMGHTTRCIPIIRELEKQGAEVLLMGTEQQLTFLQKYFPNAEYILSESLTVRYSKWLPAWLKIILQAPDIKRNIHEEYTSLQSLVKTRQIDAVISDNRYGLHSNDCISILITHQLELPLPLVLSPFRWISRRNLSKLLRPFNHIWLPDFPNHALSGALSKASFEVEALGCLSRFESSISIQTSSRNVLAILSGPEPQRSIFFLELLRISTSNPTEITFVIDEIPDMVSSEMLQNCWVFIRPSDDEFQQLIQSHEAIICRSGYSSLMDLYRLGKKSLLVPTPGQTEQEYLANYWEEKGFVQLPQAELKQLRSFQELLQMCPTSHVVTSTEKEESAALLQQAIAQLMQRISIKTNHSRRTYMGNQ